MQTRCKNGAGGQREGEMGEDRRDKHGEKVGFLGQFPVSHYLSHLLDITASLLEREVEDGGMKGRTVA